LRKVITLEMGVQISYLWVPRYRRKVLYGKVRKRVGEVIRELCTQCDFEIIEGHAMPDQIVSLKM